jgi:putative DNA primase/helicase
VIAAQIATALGGAREGREWRCPCPTHGGRSLTLADGRDGKLLVHCFGGCDSREVFAALRDCGLINGGRADTSREREAEWRRRREAAAKAETNRLARAVSRARDLYRRGMPAAGTPVEAYFRGRGLTGPVPTVLRFVEFCPHRNGRYYPAMVAPIVNVHGEQTAIQKTFLRPDGSGKARLPKEEQREICGPMKGGAVRLAPYRPDCPLILGEGIETLHSAMRLFGLPGWAALCANGLVSLHLPDEIRRIVIAADNDVGGAGQRAARDAAWIWGGEGRGVRVSLPSVPGTDFNDVIKEKQ